MFNLEMYVQLLCVLYGLCLEKKKKIYSAARFMISDDVEVLLVVLSGNWRFPLSPFINKGGALQCVGIFPFTISSGTFRVVSPELFASSAVCT
jgi:hypothetical protein